MPDKKLTDNEIVKALECHSRPSNSCSSNCPYLMCEEVMCTKKLSKDALNLINRLQAENKRLSTLAELGDKRANDYRVMRDRALKAEAEIERLKDNGKLESENIILNALIEMKNDTINNLMKMVDMLESQLKTAKAEAVSEFVERLKEYVFRADSHKDGFEHNAVDIDDVENLSKELVGENGE